MSGAPSPRARLAALAALPDDAVDLAEAALLLAQDDRPDLDVAAWLARVDGLAAAAAGRVRAAPDAPGQVAALCRFLFEERGLAGDRDTYDAPENSHLDRVLERGRGLPITLAVLLVAVARRLGLPLVGVSFPGHFLVRHRDLPLVLDPFDGGRALDEPALRALLRRATGGDVDDLAPLLAPATPREVLARMNRNLKGTHLRRGALAEALAAIERLLLLAPDDPAEVRDRGLVLLALDRPGAAVEALARYLALRPDAPDARPVAARLEEAQAAAWARN